MSVLYYQGIAAVPSLAGRHLHYAPCAPTTPDAGFPWSRRLRLHFPELAELLDDWYDRAAENCDQFLNISEVDRYSVTCTVCRHFDASGCISAGTTTADIIALLNRARQHDSL